MKILAIDFSLTSCAVAWRSAAGRTSCNVIQKYNNSVGHYESSRKCLGVVVKSIKRQSKSNEQLNLQILPFFLNGLINFINPDKVYIESYAFNAVGRVPSIAESLGIVKNHLLIENIPYESVTPQTIKKHFTGKGNASKQMMIDELENRFGKIDMGKHEKSKSDVADSVALLLHAEEANFPEGTIVCYKTLQNYRKLAPVFQAFRYKYIV